MMWHKTEKGIGLDGMSVWGRGGEAGKSGDTTWPRSAGVMSRFTIYM